MTTLNINEVQEHREDNRLKHSYFYFLKDTFMELSSSENKQKMLLFLYNNITNQTCSEIKEQWVC